MKFVSFVPYVCDLYAKDSALDAFALFTQPCELGLLIEDSKNGDKIYPFSKLFVSDIPRIYTDMLTFIQFHTQEMLDSMQQFHTCPYAFSMSQVTLLAPIPMPRQDVICLGINYLDHARESAAFKNEAFDEKRENAVYFSKRVNYATPHNAPIAAHSHLTQKLDYEVELGVILKSHLYQPKTKQEALDSIFGYTIINDISARDIQQKHKQWYMGKSLQGSLPMGPCVLYAKDVNPQNLTIKSYVNNELRQDSHTSLMICDVASALYELSHYCLLQAGSIISMGTPSGVGMGFNPPRFLQKGDEVICEIESVGSLRNFVI